MLRTGAVDRDGVVELALVRLGSRRSAWNAADARGEVERIIASGGGVVDRAVRRELAEDLTARVIAASRPLLPRSDVPEHVRSFTSVDVLAVEHEIVDRLATRAEAKTITVIEGAAGAGKTARLAATRERAIAAGRRLVVVTPTLKAAQVAEGAIGAASYSAAWLLHQHGFRWDEDGRWSRGDSVPDVSARLRRGDLLVVDEAGMVDQDTARALLRLADETKALVILVGDRHQLPAVGRGGVLDLAIRYAPDRVQQLDGVRRFKDPRYAELSVRMRTGTAPGEVFDELLAHGEIVIHGSDVERTRRLAAEASVGKLVVADTREQVGRINAFAHRIRKATGEVDEQVLTAAGERLGVGDTIATRRNNRDADVANRELWSVVSCDRGALTVRGEAGTRVLPPDYVRRDVELAYATTAYGAQGATVNESHVLVGEHSGAASAYVGMTRGRERNVTHLVAESVEDARKQWCDVFGRDRADLGPAHAREAAVEAIERYGPKARKNRPIPSLPPEFDHRRPTPSPSGPGIGF